MEKNEFPTTAERRTYCMVCPQGQYMSNSWLSLGWAIFTHRLWHLCKHGRWMD